MISGSLITNNETENFVGSVQPQGVLGTDLAFDPDSGVPGAVPLESAYSWGTP